MSSTTERGFPQLDSVEKISKIPLVQSGRLYAVNVYSKIKGMNSLTRWGLERVEGGIYVAVDKSLYAFPFIQVPIAVLDTIICKGIEQIEQRVPAINYSTEYLACSTKSYVEKRLVQPVLKRADSVKEMTITGAHKYGTLAASRLDNALDVAEKYVDKYLPDASDSADSGPEMPYVSKRQPIHTIVHVKGFSRKLKRRLARRTLAEGRALQKRSIDTVQCLAYFANLLIRDPKQFMEKMKVIWVYLSEDEPENQVPPANLEQVITMLAREMARRCVHFTNFSFKMVSLFPNYFLHSTHWTLNSLNTLVEELLKRTTLKDDQGLKLTSALSPITYANVSLQQIIKLANRILEELQSQLQEKSKGLKEGKPMLSPSRTEGGQQERPKTPQAENKENEEQRKKNQHHNHSHSPSHAHTGKKGRERKSSEPSNTKSPLTATSSLPPNTQ